MDKVMGYLGAYVSGITLSVVLIVPFGSAAAAMNSPIWFVQIMSFLTTICAIRAFQKLYVTRSPS